MATHTYTTSLTWAGSTPDYESYHRVHDAVIGPLSARVSADPSFRGDPALVNPEQLLVAAAASCQMLSFLAVCSLSKVDVLSYTDEAVGTMDDTVKPVRVGEIVLRPHLVVRPQAGATLDEAKVLRLVEKAHRTCYIANSLNSDIRIDPTIEIRPTP